MTSPPKVFISYSWDSPEHKQWVGTLAGALRSVGIDAILDQWDLSPGEDVTLFMERGLAESERVIVVCTEQYVRKADGGKGGVGYERMIVTAEILANLGTKKFVPIIRQGQGEKVLPKFMGARFYVDFSDDTSFSAKLEELAREIHNAPELPKPPLGRNPFAASADSEIEDSGNRELIDVKLVPISPQETYEAAIALVRQEDFLGWRQLMKRLKPRFTQGLLEIRKKAENNPPRDWNASKTLVDEAMTMCSPLMVAALAAVESGAPRFRDQRALVDDLLGMAAWQIGGNAKIYALPQALVFIYQALHGAISLETGQQDIALDLAEMRLASPFDDKRLPMWSRHEFIGWPDSLDGDCGKAWEYLIDAYRQWPSLQALLPSEDDYLRGLTAYYMALNINEYSDVLARGEGAQLLQQSERVLKVPIEFAAESKETCESAFRLLTRNPVALARIWEHKGVDATAVRDHWPAWVRVCSRWIFLARHNFTRFPLTGLLDALA